MVEILVEILVELAKKEENKKMLARISILRFTANHDTSKAEEQLKVCILALLTQALGDREETKQIYAQMHRNGPIKLDTPELLFERIFNTRHVIWLIHIESEYVPLFILPRILCLPQVNAVHMFLDDAHNLFRRIREYDVLENLDSLTNKKIRNFWFAFDAHQTIYYESSDKRVSPDLTWNSKGNPCSQCIDTARRSTSWQTDSTITLT